MNATKTVLLALLPTASPATGMTLTVPTIQITFEKGFQPIACYATAPLPGNPLPSTTTRPLSPSPVLIFAPIAMNVIRKDLQEPPLIALPVMRRTILMQMTQTMCAKDSLPIAPCVTTP